ncbi:MAG: penicillin-binding protein 2 [Minisyncoccia bacterium]
MFHSHQSISKKPSSQKIEKPLGFGHWRANMFLILVFLVFGLVFYRLLDLTVLKRSDFLTTAGVQNAPTTDLSKRGKILISNYSDNTQIVAAENKTVNILYSNNENLTDPADDVAGKLDKITGIDRSVLAAKLSEAGKTYQVLADGISDAVTGQINDLKIKGIYITTQIERDYPLGTLASQELGFVGFQGNNRSGQYGVEAYYDDVLSGVKAEKQNNPAGSDIVLTIDKNIQEKIEATLTATLKKWKSPSGTIIVQDPKTGNILGMVSSPSFDPNHYSDFDLNRFIDPAVQSLYEPGSSFKPVTMSGGINTGAVTPNTTYTDTGEDDIDGRVIKNFDEKAHGVKTMRQVLELSLNTGAVFVEGKMGDDAFLNDVVAFGFGQKTGIDLSGEIGGNISQLYNNRKINFATASFGQGIAVTPIQLINAYSAIANNGRLMKPNIVKEIIAPDGSKQEITPQIIGSPITEETAHTLQSMLTDVVDIGFDKARVQGYDIAGKTGTAQIPDPVNGGYLSQNVFIHNFLGFAPSYNARFTVLIKMDRPQGITFASDSLSPVFGELARYLIRYFNVAPTR